MATIRDVAQRAGVAVSTVSRFLNKNINLPEKTEQKIIRAIDELNFSPNKVARSLVSKKSEILVVVVPDISSPFFSHVVKDIEKSAHKDGFNVILCDTDNNLDKEREQINSLRNSFIAGYILVGAIDDVNDPCGDILKNMQEKGEPVVLIDRHNSDNTFPQVIHDKYLATLMATEHLIRLGHRQIGFITGDLRVYSALNALKGFKAAMANISKNESDMIVVEGGFDLDKGIRSTEMLLQKHPQVTGLVVFSELALIGAYNKLMEMGISIPQDISLIGIGETDLAKIVQPPLTTVGFDFAKTGELAYRQLKNLIVGKSMDERNITLKPEIFIRSSTRFLD